MAQVCVNGAVLEYEAAGEGEPVVFVHGSASDYRTWEGVMPTFAKTFRVCRYSRRHHWPNPPVPGGDDYRMDEHVADLRSMLVSLGFAPAHLVGHSYGAVVCLLLARDSPDLVRSLVLTEPPVVTLFVSSRPRPTELLRLLVTRPRTGAAVAWLGARGRGPATAAARRGDLAAAARHFGTAVLGREAFRSLSADRMEQVRQNLIPAELLGSGMPRIVPASLRSIRAPSLLVTARGSPAVFHRFADRLEELLPRTRRVDIPAASHIVHEDNPTAFAAAVGAFLSSDFQRAADA